MSPGGQEAPAGRAVDEGYLKFELSWDRAAVRVPPEILAALERWRTRLRAVGVVGARADGVGFGNLSHRAPCSPTDLAGAPTDLAGSLTDAPGRGARFFVSGSATGGLACLGEEHYALVTGYSLERNTLACCGMAKASSESLSHAAIYEAVPAAQAVIHVHSDALWNAQVNRLPTTPAAAEYGTPEMARALRELAGRVAGTGGRIIVMGGHRDGVIAFGATPDEAGEEILRLLSRSS